MLFDAVFSYLDGTSMRGGCLPVLGRVLCEARMCFFLKRNIFQATTISSFFVNLAVYW